MWDSESAHQSGVAPSVANGTLTVPCVTCMEQMNLTSDHDVTNGFSFGSIATVGVDVQRSLHPQLAVKTRSAQRQLAYVHEGDHRGSQESPNGSWRRMPVVTAWLR